MSAYIKGMEMPNECRGCLMMVYHESTGKTWCSPADAILAEGYKPIPFDGRPDWCPLVEVKTPHGDLIDKNELESRINFVIAFLKELADEIGLGNEETQNLLEKSQENILNSTKRKKKQCKKHTDWTEGEFS